QSEEGEVGGGLDRVLLDEQHGDERAERPADDEGPIGLVEVVGEERPQLARPLRAVVHRPPIFGKARIGDGVSRLEQAFTELHDPRGDVYRRGIGQRHRRRGASQWRRSSPPLVWRVYWTLGLGQRYDDDVFGRRGRSEPASRGSNVDTERTRMAPGTFVTIG